MNFGGGGVARRGSRCDNNMIKYERGGSDVTRIDGGQLGHGRDSNGMIV